MSNRIEIPFESIENAQQYIRLLAEVVTEAKRDIGDEITLAIERMSQRRLQALRVVEYNLEKLQRHLSACGRTLNDLRSLRRLLHEERTDTTDAKQHQVDRTASLTVTSSASEPPRAGEASAVSNL